MRLGEDGKAALTRAIRTLEQTSSIEVVVAIRKQSGRYRSADFAVAVLIATFTLAFLLFSPWPFTTAWLFVDTLIAGALGFAAAGALPALRRMVTSPSARRARVELHAKATFVDKRLTKTRDRTGLLVYVSQLERRAEVVGDEGVLAALSSEQWRAARESIDRVMAAGGDATELATTLTDLAPLLSAALPARDDDTNELGDEVCA